MSTSGQAPGLRPARKQVPEPVITPSQKGRNINFWSGRSLDPRPADHVHGARTRSKYRCHPEIDSGRTRGDIGQTNVFCLYFARGICAEGANCQYLHRLPTELDEARSMTSHSNDIFGRPLVHETEAGREYRGPTAQQRATKTLYVNYGGACHYDVITLRKMVETSFSPWGPISDIFIARSKGLAFVTYQWRTTAEFAKEAMDGQGLAGSDCKEVLGVRWAHDDRAPTAVIERKRNAELALGKAAMRAMDQLPPEVKRTRMMQLQMGLLQQTDGGLVNRAVSDYPDTDGQYPDAADEAEEEPDVSYDPAEVGAVGTLQQGSAGGAAAAAAAAGCGGGGGDAAGATGQQAAEWGYYDPSYYQYYAQYYGQQQQWDGWQQQQQGGEQQAGGKDAQPVAATSEAAADGGAGGAVSPAAEDGVQKQQEGAAEEVLGLLAAYSSDDEG